MHIFKRSNFLAAFLAALFCTALLMQAPSAEAAMGSIRSFTLIGESDAAHKDVTTKGDAGFSVSLTGAGAITRVTLKDLTAGKTWDSSRSGGAAMLAVRGGENDEVLNSNGSLGLFPFILGTQFTIWTDDRNTVLAKDATFELTVHFADGSSTVQKLDVKGIAKPGSGSSGTGSSAGQIVSARYIGRQTATLSGPGTIKGHALERSAPKLVVEARVRGKGTITGFRLRNQSGPAGTWDTGMNDASKLLLVANESGALFNKSDGSVSIAIDGERTLHLAVTEDDALSNSSAHTVLFMYMDGNRVFQLPVDRSGSSSGGTGSQTGFKSLDYRGRGSYDFVGEDPKPGSNLNPDYSIAMAPNAAGTITGVKIVGDWRTENSSYHQTWDTVPTSKNYAIVVTRADGRPINRLDGSISERIEAGEALYAWFDTDSEISRNLDFKVTLLYSDGKVVTGEIKTAR